MKKPIPIQDIKLAGNFGMLSYRQLEAKITTLTTALAADRKLLCRIATFFSSCDSSSPKLPELISDVENALIAASEKDNSNVAPPNVSA